MAEESELAAIWAAGVQDYMVLPGSDRIRLALYLQRMTVVIEAQRLHPLNHNVNPAYFEPTRLAYFESLTFREIQEWWELARDSFESEFRSHVDEMVIQAKQKGCDSSFTAQSKSRAATVWAHNGSNHLNLVRLPCGR